jgi:hypothetical protein
MVTIGTAFPRGTMASDRRLSRSARRRVPVGLASICGLLLAACTAAPAASGPSAATSTAAPSASASPSISLITPGPSKQIPGATDTYTGILSFDSIEGGCAFLQTADGRKLEILYPEGWTLQRSTHQLLAPDGSVHGRAGDTVSVRGTEATDMASICQVGPIIRATEVLPG